MVLGQTTLSARHPRRSSLTFTEVQRLYISERHDKRKGNVLASQSQVKSKLAFDHVGDFSRRRHRIGASPSAMRMARNVIKTWKSAAGVITPWVR